MFKNIPLLFFLGSSLVIQSCSSLINDLSQPEGIRIKNNRYISSQTYFSVDIPSIMNSETIIINEYGLGMESQRVVVNFGPNLPDRVVFTVQIAHKDLYDEITNLGNVNIFTSGSNNTIRDDFSKYFFNQIFRNLKEYKFKRLVHKHFKHQGRDVTYSVFKDMSANKTIDLNYVPPDIYYVFYLTEMNYRGVLVWLQIPITSEELDGRSEYNLVHRKWDVQNDFFNSLKVTN